MSLIDLVLNASFTVQAVMLLLLLASVLSWYMISQRYIYYRSARNEMYDFEEKFWSGIDLSQLYREGNERAADGEVMVGMESIFRAGFKEFSRLAKQSEMDSEAIMEGARRAMRVATMREEERLERHLAFLASVGSTSPYIGLFGTVWAVRGDPGGDGLQPLCLEGRYLQQSLRYLRGRIFQHPLPPGLRPARA
jgi:biopolymer transport protein TolQ